MTTESEGKRRGGGAKSYLVGNVTGIGSEISDQK